LVCCGLSVAWGGRAPASSRGSRRGRPREGGQRGDNGDDEPPPRPPSRKDRAVTTVPDGFNDLLTAKKAFANLATINPDGTPQVTPVWFDWDGRHLRINSAKGRIKDKNLRSTPTEALCIRARHSPIL